MISAPSFSWPRAIFSSIPPISFPMFFANQCCVIKKPIDFQCHIRENEENSYYDLKKKQWKYLTISFILSTLSTIPGWVHFLTNNDPSNEHLPVSLIGVTVPTWLIGVVSLFSLAQTFKYNAYGLTMHIEGIPADDDKRPEQAGIAL